VLTTVDLGGVSGNHFVQELVALENYLVNN